MEILNSKEHNIIIINLETLKCLFFCKFITCETRLLIGDIGVGENSPDEYPKLFVILKHFKQFLFEDNI